MKISELRRVAQNERDNPGYGHFLSVDGMRELVADIDGAIGSAKLRALSPASERTMAEAWAANVMVPKPGNPGAFIACDAPADSPLGVELSKIRDRLNALENNAASIRRMEEIREAHSDRLCALEIFNLHDAFDRIAALETKLETNTASRVTLEQLFKRIEALAGWRGKLA